MPYDGPKGHPCFDEDQCPGSRGAMRSFVVSAAAVAAPHRSRHVLNFQKYCRRSSVTQLLVQCQKGCFCLKIILWAGPASALIVWAFIKYTKVLSLKFVCVHYVVVYYVYVCVGTLVCVSSLRSADLAPTGTGYGCRSSHYAMVWI